MSNLNLDYQENLPFPWLGTGLLGLALCVLILTGSYYFRLIDEAASLEAKAAQAQDSISGSARHPNRGSSADLAQEVKVANNVLRQLSVPWEPLFQAIEFSGDNKVTLLSLEQDLDKQQIKIIGETKNFKALIDYITRLQGQAVFSSVYLQSHHVQQQDPERPVRFSLYTTWREEP